MHLLVSCLAAALLLLHVGVAPAANAAPGTFIYAGCSPSRYGPNTAFESNLNSLLDSISSTASSGATYNSFTAGVDSGGGATLGPEAAAVGAGSAAYGLYQCRGDLGPVECVACVHDTVARLGAVCANAYAASLQSDGCHVRYDASDFIGRADTSVAYRRCSSGTSGDAGFLRGRDAVLAELQDGTAAVAPAGYYKMSTSGAVQGVAQCLGDIAAGDCTACLAQAVAQLRGTCGAGLAADVYLAQCSVRYWTNGNYFRPSQDNSGDDVGRTVAIIIGILAGLALLVVFISFLRKTCKPSKLTFLLALLWA
ncbi:plasmodesmata-located protein 8-like [Phragmites australis]|uniref:plasmodesmata-located protein 8-like n=1 Tax=Phragmites australis TaxID=29695 RepID=UPI002D770D9E|nr:plasmodesmata-located protein 8-like [Phragmites australis]